MALRGPEETQRRFGAARSIAASFAVGGLLALGLVTGCGDDDSDSDDGGATTEAAQAAAEPNLTKLPLGDDKYSTDGPKTGFVYLCGAPQEGVAPTAASGPWIDEQAGTWNAEEKVSVPGKVDWPSQFEISLEGDVRRVTGNDLPDHTTGEFPIPQDSAAYEFDQNPNEIAEQDVALELPATPAVGAEPSCMGGESGILLSGAALFNGFDANGADAVAHEVQDDCDGHPQMQGTYHYHSQSDCIEDNEPGEGHSPLVGYALDGFGIYGHHGEDGEVLENSDLDECHGHTHAIDWDGETIELYHHHSTYEFPYVVSCFRAEPAQMQVVQGGEVAGGAPPQGGPPEGAPPPP